MSATAVRAAWTDLGARLAEDPLLAGLRHRLEALEGLDADAVADAVGPLTGERRWLGALLGHLRVAVRRQPLLDPPLAAGSDRSGHSLSLPAAGPVALSLAVVDPAGLDPAPAGVTVSGSLTLVRVLRPAGLVVERWTGAAVDEGFTASAAPVLRRTARWHPHAGSLIRVDGRRDALALLAAVGRPVLLRATIRTGAAPFARVHATDDGRLLSATGTDEGAARMAMLASLLAETGGAGAADAVATLLDERDFSLRWLGARALLRLDAARGGAALDRLAAGDPHPEVRAAAAAAAARLCRAA